MTFIAHVKRASHYANLTFGRRLKSVARMDFWLPEDSRDEIENFKVGCEVSVQPVFKQPNIQNPLLELIQVVSSPEH